MLENVSIAEVKRIAQAAKAARNARNVLLEKVPEGKLGEPKPAKGTLDPAAAIGLDPLPPDHPARVALEKAVNGASTEACRELCALLWVGHGEYGAKGWSDALVQAAALQDSALTALLLSEADLDEMLSKGLRELKFA